MRQKMLVFMDADKIDKREFERIYNLLKSRDSLRIQDPQPELVI